MAAVVARPNVQHPQRVPLGGLPAVWCYETRFAPLSTNTQASWKMYRFVWRAGGAVNQSARFLIRLITESPASDSVFCFA